MSGAIPGQQQWAQMGVQRCSILDLRNVYDASSIAPRSVRGVIEAQSCRGRVGVTTATWLQGGMKRCMSASEQIRRQLRFATGPPQSGQSRTYMEVPLPGRSVTHRTRQSCDTFARASIARRVAMSMADDVIIAREPALRALLATLARPKPMV